MNKRFRIEMMIILYMSSLRVIKFVKVTFIATKMRKFGEWSEESFLFENILRQGIHVTVHRLSVAQYVFFTEY